MIVVVVFAFVCNALVFVVAVCVCLLVVCIWLLCIVCALVCSVVFLFKFMCVVVADSFAVATFPIAYLFIHRYIVC